MIVKSKILNWLLCIAHSFISNHITIDNYYYLLSLCLTKKYDVKNIFIYNVSFTFFLDQQHIKKQTYKT